MAPRIITAPLLLQLLLLLCTTTLHGHTSTVEATQQDVVVAAYLPEWRYEGFNWEAMEHVSHLILFSLEPNADGTLGALDRIPRPEILAEAAAAAEQHDSKLMLCIGGNGRSRHFRTVVRSRAARRRFAGGLTELAQRLGIPNFDLNWEYPGYSFSHGYLPKEEVERDYRGLAALAKDIRQAFDKLGQPMVLSLAYYPDGKQEQLLHKYGAHKHVDFMHMMAYDQNGGHHSSLEFAQRVVKQALDSPLPNDKITLGLPFYGRNRHSSDWVTYEDLVQQNDPLDAAVDELGPVSFNGRDTIRTKTALAIDSGLGGVMIWEVGQDCRRNPVVRKGKVEHVATCPKGDDSSLLVALAEAIQPPYRRAGSSPASSEAEL